MVKRFGRCEHADGRPVDREILGCDHADQPPADYRVDRLEITIETQVIQVLDGRE